MDSMEFTQWIEFFTKIEYLPSERNAQGLAVVAAAAAGSNQVESFVIRRTPPQTQEQIAGLFGAFAASALRARERAAERKKG